MNRRIAMLMMGSIAVAGCANVEPHMNRGTVLGKDFNPGFTERVDKCAKYATRKPKTPSNCATWKTSYEWHDQCWRLYLQEGDRTGEVCVSRVVYENYRVGDHYQAS